jgi:hypothetical protein
LSQIDLVDRRWRKKKSSELSGVIRSSIDHFQNPADCRAAKKLICRFENDTTPGFDAAAVQSSLICLMLSIYTNRTLILLWNERNYAYFEPLGSCSIDDVNGDTVAWDGNSSNFSNELCSRNTAQNFDIPRRESRQLIHSLNMRVDWLMSGSIIQEILKFNANPFAWYSGQVAGYLFRINGNFLREIESSKERLKLQETSTVG